MKDTLVHLRILTATLSMMIVAAAEAESSRDTNGQALASTKAGQSERVRILPDQQRGEIRFEIDGQPVLRVTSQSIIVSGSVIYTGVIQDTGSGN